jgi:hypothetical protein
MKSIYKMQSSTINQRISRRYSIKCACAVKKRSRRASSDESPMQAETQNISNRGLFFTITGKWEIGDTIQCELQLPAIFPGKTNRVSCQGKIARIIEQPDGTIGIGATIESFQFVARP